MFLLQICTRLFRNLIIFLSIFGHSISFLQMLVFLWFSYLAMNWLYLHFMTYNLLFITSITRFSNWDSIYKYRRKTVIHRRRNSSKRFDLLMHFEDCTNSQAKPRTLRYDMIGLQTHKIYLKF